MWRQLPSVNFQVTFSLLLFVMQQLRVHALNDSGKKVERTLTFSIRHRLKNKTSMLIEKQTKRCRRYRFKFTASKLHSNLEQHSRVAVNESETSAILINGRRISHVPDIFVVRANSKPVLGICVRPLAAACLLINTTEKY